MKNLLFFTFAITIQYSSQAWSTNREGLNYQRLYQRSETKPTELLPSSLKDPLSLCGDWYQLGSKCYKIIDTKSAKCDAIKSCQSLDKSSSLVRIGSAKEQDDVHKIIKAYKKSSMVPLYGRMYNKYTKNFDNDQSGSSSIWLGIRFINNTFQWDDGTRIDYVNWRVGSPFGFSSGELCAKMSMDTGKWSDVPCDNKNLVLCQKYNELTLANIYGAFRNVYFNLTARINQQDEIIEQLKKEVAEAKSSESESQETVTEKPLYLSKLGKN